MSMPASFYIDVYPMFSKSNGTLDQDGALTPKGFDVVAAYARAWVNEHTRHLDTEREHPALQDYFDDVREDSEVALRYADAG